jgi:hypothetical protein
MHPKERAWLDKVMASRPAVDGSQPKTEAIIKWLEEILPEEFKTAQRVTTDRRDDRQKLSPPEWSIFQELVRIYNGEDWPWIRPFIWALNERYNLVLRYVTIVEDGYIRYDINP